MEVWGEQNFKLFLILWNELCLYILMYGELVM